MRYYHLIVLSLIFGIVSSKLYSQDSTGINTLGKQLDIISKKYKTTELATSYKKKENNSRPNEFKLYQNYPNPFNPTTVITYQLKESDYVELKVYDVLCHEIALLVDKVQPAGYYQIAFDGTNLSDGIYFYRLQTGKFVDVKKMVLVK